MTLTMSDRGVVIFAAIGLYVEAFKEETEECNCKSHMSLNNEVNEVLRSNAGNQRKSDR